MDISEIYFFLADNVQELIISRMADCISEEIYMVCFIDWRKTLWFYNEYTNVL